MNLGKIKHTKITGDVTILTIYPKTFAPGIWAGTEGMTVYINYMAYKVVGVDLHHRLVMVEGKHLIPRLRSIYSQGY